MHALGQPQREEGRRNLKYDHIRSMEHLRRLLLFRALIELFSYFLHCHLFTVAALIFSCLFLWCACIHVYMLAMNSEIRLRKKIILASAASQEEIFFELCKQFPSIQEPKNQFSAPLSTFLSHSLTRHAWHM